MFWWSGYTRTPYLEHVIGQVYRKLKEYHQHTIHCCVVYQLAIWSSFCCLAVSLWVVCLHKVFMLEKEFERVLQEWPVLSLELPIMCLFLCSLKQCCYPKFRSKYFCFVYTPHIKSAPLIIECDNLLNSGGQLSSQYRKCYWPILCRDWCG